MSTSQTKYCTVTYENALSGIIDGFVGQIIFSLTEATEVVKGIGNDEELIYRGTDDHQEMQVQMMVDYHLQRLDKELRETIIQYVKRNKLLIKGGRHTSSTAAENKLCPSIKLLDIGSKLSMSA